MLVQLQSKVFTQPLETSLSPNEMWAPLWKIFLIKVSVSASPYANEMWVQYCIVVE